MFIIRIKSREQGIPGFSVPQRLGGVICKPEDSTKPEGHGKNRNVRSTDFILFLKCLKRG